MSSYYFSPLHPKGVRLDWEQGEKVRVSYKNNEGKRVRRIGKIHRIDGTSVSLAFRNQFVCTWFSLDQLSKIKQTGRPPCQHKPGMMCPDCNKW